MVQIASRATSRVSAPVIFYLTRFTFTFVIPGWSEGPDPESRDSGFVAAATPRNDGVTNLKSTSS
jgi:hypothetical protein